MSGRERATARVAGGQDPNVRKPGQWARGFRRVMAMSLLLPVMAAVSSAPASADEHNEGARKVFVCKYTGTPGVNEELQGGGNPLEVDASSIPVFGTSAAFDTAEELIRQEFADQQGQSIVIAVELTPENNDDDPGVAECPLPRRTALAPVFSDPCGPNNTSLVIPTQPAGVQFTEVRTATTITVTFTAAAGYQLVGQSVFVFTINDAACPAPAVVVFVDRCEPPAGEQTRDRIFIPADANFTYTVNGTHVPTGGFVAISADTYTVTAVAKAGVTVATGATTQWTFRFTKVLCSEVLGAQATRVRGAVAMIDKCGRAGDSFRAKRVRGVTYKVSGNVIREGVWLKARTRTVKVRAVASNRRFRVVGQDVWTLRFTNKPCAKPPEVLPATGV